MGINEIYQAAIAGDKKAEGRLFELLGERFRQFARHRLRDKAGVADVVQDALLIIAREFRQIRIETSFAAWAYKVLDYRILNHYKSQSRESRVVGDTVEGGVQPETGEVTMLRQRLLKCLSKLHATNPRYARIVNLYQLGYRAEEICEKMELTKNAFYILLYRSRVALKACLDREETS